MPSLNHTVTGINPANGIRLDLYIAQNLCLLSRSQIKARKLSALVNGKESKISRLIKCGDILELNWNEAEPVNLVPENIPLTILYEDDHVAVINKDQGMVVHPGAGIRSGTLANALYYRRLEKGVMINTENIRPGIVHRLDKDTSGVIIAAYDEDTLVFLADQFKARKVRKTYIAIVSGTPKEKKGRIETYMARDLKDRKRFVVSSRGKSALSYYSVIKTWQSHSLLLLRPKTGRTHQLRVHLRYLGHPVIGDPLYGVNDSLFPHASLMLHARKLEITLPGESDSRVFTAPVPWRFRSMIDILDNRA